MSRPSGSKSFQGKDTEIYLEKKIKITYLTSYNSIISADGEVTDPALPAPEAGTALVDPSLRRGVDPGPGIEASVCSRVAVPGPGSGRSDFSPSCTIK